MAGTRKYVSPGGKNKVGLLNSGWAKSKQCLFEHVSEIMSVGKRTSQMLHKWRRVMITS